MEFVATLAAAADIVDSPADPAIARWLVAFAATQLVEIPIYLFAQRRHPLAQRRATAPPRLAAQLWIAFAASAITHPIAWGLGAVLRPFWVYALVAETFAVVIEALWLRRHGVPQAAWWSLTANAASVAAFIAARPLLT